MIKCDVAIIGAGPAGLFAAYELINSGLSVCVIDKGKEAKERTEGIEGVGGAGAFTDGKLNLIAQGIGGDLVSLGNSPKTIQELIDRIDDAFTLFGAPNEYSGTNEVSLAALERQALAAGIELIKARQRHIGTTAVRQLTQRFYEYLVKEGIVFLLSTQLRNIVVEENGFLLESPGEFINANYVILAPGRAGASWLRKTLLPLKIKPRFGPIDIGVRVEFPHKIYEPIREIMYDAKFKIRTNSGTQVRTFCTNPQGFVTVEKYKDCITVNGHADRERLTSLTNFALLCRERLTTPLSDTNEYGRLIAITCNTLGENKPLAQSLFDLLRGRRSDEHRLQELPFEPSLKDITAGDIRLGLPAKVLSNIVEAIQRLSKIMPGLEYGEQVLLYAPEVKFYSDRYPLSAQMETSLPGLFIAGDASGHTEGIPHAAASGILAAQAILKKA